MYRPKEADNCIDKSIADDNCGQNIELGDVMKNKLLLFLLVAVVAGCSSGPMRQLYGPYETPVFSAIGRELADDGSQEILYKEWTPMYENGKLLSYGVFFITDKGVYMGLWDKKNYRYSLIYKAPIGYITSLTEDTLKKGEVEKVLVIKDKFGIETSFGVKGRRAIRAILETLMEKLSEEGQEEEE